MDSDETNNFSLLSDEAVLDTSRDDNLRFGPTAEVLARAALQTNSPITLGIYGNWGSGKTSLMRLMWQIVGDEKAAVAVWFNAWQYEREEHLIIPLIATIARDIKKWDEKANRFSLDDNVTDAARKALEKVKAGGKKVHDALRAVLYGVSMKGKLGVPMLGDIEINASMKDMIQRYEEVTQDTLMMRSLYFDAFDRLRDISHDEKIEKPHIVVFIDDLDRCFPEQAVRLLESIKLVLHQPQFAFVLGVYPQIIEEFIRNKYAKDYYLMDNDAGMRRRRDKYLKYFDDYLGKIVQVPHYVPERKSNEMQAYILQLLKEANVENEFLEEGSSQEDLLNLIAEVGKRNPREIVRKINGIVVNWRIKNLEEKDKPQKERVECSVMALLVHEVAGEPKYREFREDLKCLVVRQETNIQVGEWLAEELEKAQSATNHTVRIERLQEAAKTLGSQTIPPSIQRTIDRLIEDDHLCNVLRTKVGQQWLRDEQLRETLSVMVMESVKKEEDAEAESPKSSQLERILKNIQSKMVPITGGTFEMGDGLDPDNPKHTVKLDDFEISSTQVTQEEYEAIMGNNPSHFTGPDLPVECVNWHDAVAFCEKLTELSYSTGKRFTLPSEAQWECACRAGSTTSYCFGDSEEELSDYAWYGLNSERKTHPVGQKKPNSWGLYDMHGNVWEWCMDGYDVEYYEKSSPVNPVNLTDASYRVRHGGSWDYGARGCRSSDRSKSAPGSRESFLGFRVLAVPAEKQDAKAEGGRI
jgi:formylglycine-generating enzyme required for sulfatase activity/Cdc6-like AAA superfamily ATPase